jgi:hypothetical protein
MTNKTPLNPFSRGEYGLSLNVEQNRLPSRGVPRQACRGEGCLSKRNGSLNPKSDFHIEITIDCVAYLWLTVTPPDPIRKPTDWPALLKEGRFDLGLQCFIASESYSESFNPNPSNTLIIIQKVRSAKGNTW